MAWKKGQSGNPGGRLKAEPTSSKELDLRKMAQKHTRAALAVVLELMRDKANPPQVRLGAAELVMKRGHGNPVTVHANPDGTPLNFNEMSTDDLRAGLRRLEAALGTPPEMGTSSSAPLAH